jgi:hypothetical protein
MKAQMKVTDGQSWSADPHVLLALQSTSQRKGLLAFSALPDAPVMPVREPGRARRMLAWWSRRIGRPVQRAEGSSTPRERPSLTASYLAVTRLAR